MTDDTRVEVSAMDVPEEVDASQDIPLEFDVPYLGGGSQVVDNMSKGHAAIIKNYNDGTNIAEAFAEADAQENVDDYVGLMSAQKTQTDQDDLKEAFLDQPGVSPAEVEENLGALKELNTLYDERTKDIPEQIVDAASLGGGEEATKGRIKSQLMVMDTIKQLQNDLSVIDIVKDVASAFIPGKLVHDNYDATGEILGAEDFMRDLVVGFKSLSPEEQMKRWPAISEHLMETLPETRALSAIAKFIDPLGEEDLHDFNALWATIDIADAALLGTAAVTRIARLTRQLNGVKMLRDLDNVEGASDVNAVLMADVSGEAAEKAGLDRTTAVNNTLPFNTQHIDEAYAEGLSAETLMRLKAFEAETKGKVLGLADDEKTLREGLLTSEERHLAENKFEEDLVAKGYENVQVANRSPDSTQFTLDLKTGDDIVKGKTKLDLTLNDVGVYERTNSSILSDFLFSPSVTAQGSKKDAVDAALRLDSLGPKVANQLRKLQRDALSPVIGGSVDALRPSRRLEVAQLDKILLHGDDTNKVFTPDELRAGIDGVSLNERQIESYYGLRYMYDSLHFLRNTAERRKMVAQGVKSITLGGGQVKFAKVFETPLSASSSIAKEGARKIWREDTGKVVTVDTLKLDELYKEGLVLAKVQDTFKVGQDTKDTFKTVLMRKADVTGLPDQVLHFKQGYVPRVNKDAYYFLKQAEPSMIDGVRAEQGSLKTLRFFDNRAEAEEVMAQFKKDNPNMNFVVKEDRELEKQVLGSSGVGSGGGLVTGARATEKIGFGRDNLPTERLSALESLSLNIQQTEKFLTRNQWRMGMEKRWVNTAEGLGVETRGSFNPDLVPDSLESAAELKAFGEQIREWAGFPTKSEMQWDMKARGVMEWALGKGFDREGNAVKGLHYLSHSSPTAAARSAAFHTLLGWFNPVQLWVQAQGASIAFTMATKLDDPLGGFRAVKNQFALLHGSLGDAAHTARSAKHFGLKEKELAEMVELWKKTGYEDSVLNTADHAASIQNHGIAAGALRDTADKGLFFYRGGELFNRRTSFLVALDEFKKANKGVKVGDEQLKSVMTRANDMMLNLSKANRAGFQKGVASIPTQFLQVNAKIAESLLGLNGQFSRAERAKILTGQLAMYGSAGIPLGDFAIRWASEMLGLDQADVEELDPEYVKAVNEGFWGWLALNSFGADIDIGKRGAIASGLQTFVFDLMGSEATLGEQLSGAFGQVPHRFYNAYQKIKPLMMGHLANREFPDASTALQAMSHLASVTSTWNNAEKARFMHYNSLILSGSGAKVLSKDFNLGTEIGQAMGFAPSDVGRIRDLETANLERKAFRTQITTATVNLMWDYTRRLDNATDSEQAQIVEDFESAQTMLLSRLPNDHDKDLVRKAVMNKITTGDDKASKVIKTWLKDHSDGQLATLQELNSTFTSRGLIQIQQLKGNNETGEE